MEATGKIIAFEDKSGVSKTGNPYQMAELVISNNEGYEGKEMFIAFTMFAKAIERLNQRIGDTVTVSYEVESKLGKTKAGDRWFTNCVAWRVKSVEPKALEHLDEIQSKAAEQAGDDMPF